jgi:hypothetical protein
MRITSPFPIGELTEFVSQVTAKLRHSNDRLICCTDLRATRILSPDVSDRLTDMMRSDNPKVERNAIIVGEGAVFGMQIERMLREAGSPVRRSFREVEHAQSWLAELLLPQERQRLRSFLSVPVPK